ncbi:MAG: YdgA family protein, partial [Myxococcota bacterium]|nr:YdgA family protein [Myxococcota bacterium]
AEAGALPAEELAAMTAFLREMTVARLLDEGMLRPSGDRYRVEMRFEQGVFIVNGKPLGPGGLSGLMGGG